MKKEMFFTHTSYLFIILFVIAEQATSIISITPTVNPLHRIQDDFLAKENETLQCKVDSLESANLFFRWGSYMNKLGQRESGNNYTSDNGRGYVGRWQFCNKTRKHLNIHITNSSFKKDTLLQDFAMILLIRDNDRMLSEFCDWKNKKKICKRYYDKYLGVEINGITMTKSGLLAGCHIAGIGSVMNYLDSNGKRDKKDGNGVAVSEYIRDFNGIPM